MSQTSRLRRLKSTSLAVLVALATLVSIIPLVDIVYIVARRGLVVLSPSLFTTITNGVSGGLENAILGTLLIVALAIVFAGPIGIFGGIYVSEYASARVANFVRLGSDILTGVPSIVLGYFGYVTMVVWLGWGFSLLAAGITLTVMMLPYVLRSTEIALGKVPGNLREASLALGATKTHTIFLVAVRGAIPGILTGIILAISLAMGETAPLIYTAGWSNYLPSSHLTHAPVAYLTYVVWTFINEPSKTANELAYAAAFLLIVLILIFNVLARLLFQRQVPQGQR